MRRYEGKWWRGNRQGFDYTALCWMDPELEERDMLCHIISDKGVQGEPLVQRILFAFSSGVEDTGVVYSGVYTNKNKRNNRLPEY